MTNTEPTDTVALLRALAADKALTIGQAWNALEHAANEIEALRSMVDQQNATLNDAADQIEQLSAALNTALESLDQIGMMTKKGRASLHARSTTTFIRAMEGYGNDG